MQQQQWWQHKIFFGLGIVGALTYFLESIVGVLVWPAYQPLAYPIAILAAQDAPHRVGFLIAQVVAGIMIAIALAAIWSYHQFQHERRMAQGSLAMLFSFIMWVLVNNVWPNFTMVNYVVPENFPAKNIVMAVIIVGLAAAMLYYAKQIQKLNWWSLSNVLTVLALLFVIFSVLEFGMQLLNWPLRGFFDILATDSLALGLGFSSWYFMRQAI